MIKKLHCKLFESNTSVCFHNRILDNMFMVHNAQPLTKTALSKRATTFNKKHNLTFPEKKQQKFQLVTGLSKN